MTTEVYSWRVSRDLKMALEAAALDEGISVARLLDRIAREWLDQRAAARVEDEREQERLRASAMRFVGILRSGDPDRSTMVRQRVRARLRKQRG
jgi:hypothetical protein